MRTLIALLVLAALGCPASKPAGPPGSSPLAGVYRVEASTTPQGMQPGDVMLVDQSGLALYRDEYMWIRMPVAWSQNSGPGSLSGKYRKGAEVGLEATSAEKVALKDYGKVAGTLVRLQGSQAEAALAKLATVPTLEAMQGRARACVEAYRQLLPEDSSLDRVRIEDFETTASAHGVIGLAQSKLAQRCKPIPEPCKLPGLLPAQREALARQLSQCPK